MCGGVVDKVCTAGVGSKLVCWPAVLGNVALTVIHACFVQMVVSDSTQILVLLLGMYPRF